MNEEIKEIPLNERIEKLLESGWVNEFNYLENQLREARNLVCILQQKVEQLEKENKRLKEWKEDLLSENIGLENIRKEAIEIVNQYMPNYASCVKAFDELENILNKGSESNVKD